MKKIHIKKPESFKDKYTVKEFIGEGAFGTVYLIEKKKDKKLFAIKTISLKKLGNLNFSEIHKETKILKRLNHPCIIKFIESYVEKEKSYNIITEYVPNGNILDSISNYKDKKNVFQKIKF